MNRLYTLYDRQIVDRRAYLIARTSPITIIGNPRIMIDILNGQITVIVQRSVDALPEIAYLLKIGILLHPTVWTPIVRTVETRVRPSSIKRMHDRSSNESLGDPIGITVARIKITNAQLGPRPIRWTTRKSLLRNKEIKMT
jgi:hypothetical protein